MQRLIMSFLAVGLVTSGALARGASAQTASPPVAETPEPKMPPMPSMEGQQGDVSKPVTQIPSRKKGVAATPGTKTGKSRKVARAKTARRRR